MCPTPVEISAADVLGLQSYLLVVALQCEARPQYEAYTMRFRADLDSGRRHLKSYFDRRYGADGQARLDAYMTELAGRQAHHLAARGGSQACSGLLKAFEEAARIGDGNELAAYAAKKAADLPIRSPYLSQTRCGPG